MEDILVVDDEEAVSAMIETALEGRGYKVSAYSNPLEALYRIRKNEPAVLITNISMPEMSGIELSSRALDTYPKLQVIYTTGFYDGLNFNGISLLQKPFKLSELYEAVEKALEKRVQTCIKAQDQ